MGFTKSCHHHSANVLSAVKDVGTPCKRNSTVDSKNRLKFEVCLFVRGEQFQWSRWKYFSGFHPKSILAVNWFYIAKIYEGELLLCQHANLCVWSEHKWQGHQKRPYKIVCVSERDEKEHSDSTLPRIREICMFTPPNLYLLLAHFIKLVSFAKSSKSVARTRRHVPADKTESQKTLKVVLV